MVIDRRKKGCPNPDCDCNKRKVKYNPDNEFCPKCGFKLVYVCVKCYKEIEDRGPEHRICDLCEAEKAERNEVAVDKVKAVAGKAVAGIGVVGAGVFAGIVNNSEHELIKQGSKIVNVVIKNGGKALGKVVEAAIKR